MCEHSLLFELINVDIALLNSSPKNLNTKSVELNLKHVINLKNRVNIRTISYGTISNGSHI